MRIMKLTLNRATRFNEKKNVCIVFVPASKTTYDTRNQIIN